MSEYADPAEPRRPGASAEPDRSGPPKAGHGSRRPGRHAARACNLSFDSSSASVPLAIVKDSPTLMVAAVEDLCWRLAVQDWAEREPGRWDRTAHAAWQAEAERFNDKSARIRAMVDEALMAS